MGQLEKQQANQTGRNEKLPFDSIKGILLTAFLALVAGLIATLPLFSIMGVMILSIFLGMIWKSAFQIPAGATVGIEFSSKKLLRAGIILLGVRLHLGDILAVGASVVWVDVMVVAFTITVMLLLGKIFGLQEKFSTLLAVGTAICGAAAIVAVAPLIKARNDQTAIAVAFVAILGTIGTIFYTVLYAAVEIDPQFYGMLVGATLHELAHVVAAAIPGGEVSTDMAILVKMGRVALLIPVAIILGSYYSYKNQAKKRERKRIKDLPIPWFIFGFLAMSLLNTSGILPPWLIDFFISASIFLLSMAMAGLGLGIQFNDFKKVGGKAVLVGVLGSILLIVFGWVILK